jgi:phosphonate transport system substrate-binding protein
VIVEALRARKIDGIQVGVFSYLLAVENANAEAIAVYINTFAQPAVYDPRLENGYYSIIVTKKGKGIETLADLRGKTFNFGDPASTSGHLVPKAELMRAGLVPDRDIKTRFAGDHMSALVSLWNGQADAAAVSESTLRGIVESGVVGYCGFPIDEIRRERSPAEIKAVRAACPDGRLVPIHYSIAIPGTPFALRRDLPDDLKQRIKQALISTAADAEFVRRSKRWYADPSVARHLPHLDAYSDDGKVHGIERIRHAHRH